MVSPSLNGFNSRLNKSFRQRQSCLKVGLSALFSVTQYIIKREEENKLKHKLSICSRQIILSGDRW